MEIGNEDLVYLIIFMLLVSISVLLWVGPLLFEPKTDYTIYLEEISQDNKEGIIWGSHICTESVNTWVFICNEHQWDADLYNATQEDFDKLKIECPAGRLIKSTHCIGDYLNINFYDILQDGK